MKSQRWPLWDVYKRQDKVNDLKNQIAIAKENKNLSKAQRDKIIENSKKELENAKKVEAKDVYKRQVWYRAIDFAVSEIKTAGFIALFYRIGNFVSIR